MSFLAKLKDQLHIDWTIFIGYALEGEANNGA